MWPHSRTHNELLTVRTVQDRLTVVREAGGQQVGVRAAALLRQVDGHPDVLHPPLHLWRTAGRKQSKMSQRLDLKFLADKTLMSEQVAE